MAGKQDGGQEATQGQQRQEVSGADYEKAIAERDERITALEAQRANTP